MPADTPSSARHILSPLGRGIKAVAQFYGVALQPHILSRQQFGHEEILSPSQAQALLKAAHFPSRTHTKTEVLTHACPALVFEKGKKKGADTFLGLYLPTANQILTWGEDAVIPTVETAENHPIFSRKNLVFLAIFEPKKQPVKELNWFWDGFRKNRSLLGEVLLCNFFINLMTLAIPLFTMNVYDKVMPTFASSTLWVLTIGAALAVGIDVSFRLVRSRLLGRLQHDCAQTQDITLLQSVLNFKGLPTSASARGELFQTLARAREGLVNAVLPTVLDIPFIFIFIAVIGMLSSVLMWIPICLILFIVAVQTFLTFRYQHLTHTDVQARQKREHFLYVLLENTLGLKLNNAIGKAVARWAGVNAHAAQQQQFSTHWHGLGQTLALGTAQASSVLILVVGAFQIHAGNMTIGALIATSIIGGRCLSPAIQSVNAWVQWFKVKAMLRSLATTLQQEEGAHTSLQQETLPPLTAEQLANTPLLRAQNITFSYPNTSTPALQQVTFTLPHGRHIGVLGRNGAGKSTLAHMLTGFLHPDEGELLLQGVDVTRLNEHTLREAIFLVPQSPKFWGGTIEDIIADTLHPDAERMARALTLSGFAKMMQHKGWTLQTELSPFVPELSGGQKQMLALAQAFYHEPKLLILDEPTSHFDNEQEQAFIGLTQRWLQETGATLMLITHRLNLLALAQDVMLFEQGKLAIQGERDKVITALQQQHAKNKATTQEVAA